MEINLLSFREKAMNVVNFYNNEKEKEIDSIIVEELRTKLEDPNVNEVNFREYFKELEQEKQHILGNIHKQNGLIGSYNNQEHEIVHKLLKSKEIDKGRTFSYISSKLLSHSLSSLRVLAACIFGLDFENKGVITATDYKGIFNLSSPNYKEMKEGIEQLKDLKVDIVFKDIAPKPYSLYVFKHIEYDDSVLVTHDRHITYGFTSGIDDVLSIIFQLLLRPDQPIENRVLATKDIKYLSRVYNFNKRFSR